LLSVICWVMNVCSIGVRVRRCVLIHFRMESTRAYAAECSSVGDRHSNVAASVRWTRQSCTYCSYVTVQGPSPLSVSGKRRLVLEHSAFSVDDWNGRRFGREPQAWNNDIMCCKKLWNLESTHGGMSFRSGFHFDFTQSFGGVLVVVWCHSG
jgi:hypothetical protein